MVDKTEKQKYLNLFREQGYLIDPSDLVTRADIEQNISKARSTEQRDESAFLQTCIGIMKKNRKCNVILFSKKQFTLAVSKTGRKLYPLLDDVAQLTGRAIRCVDSLQSIKNRLPAKNALFVHTEGCLCMAANFYEVHALAMVIEKASGAHIASFILGGGKPIKAHEAVLMRLIYVLKYSKKLK